MLDYSNKKTVVFRFIQKSRIGTKISDSMFVIFSSIGANFFTIPIMTLIIFITSSIVSSISLTIISILTIRYAF